MTNTTRFSFLSLPLSKLMAEIETINRSNSMFLLAQMEIAMIVICAVFRSLGKVYGLSRRLVSEPLFENEHVF